MSYSTVNQMFKILALISLSFLIGCSSPKRIIQNKVEKRLLSDSYNNQFTGLVVFDPELDDILYNFNGERYFTPASNTKIATLYSALNYLPEHIPALKYYEQNDTLFIEGTGDPTFLHPDFENNKTVDFLRDYQNISLYLQNFEDDKFGPGWAWEDYQYDFQAQKGAFPMYGNSIRILPTHTVSPSIFKDSVLFSVSKQNRSLEKNTFFYQKDRQDTLDVPFKTSIALTQRLLESVLDKKIPIITKPLTGVKKTFYGIEADTVYKRMMHESDNFLAEQLLLGISSELFENLNSRDVIEHLLKNELADLNQEPRWVDGSGLSRYNLFTPLSLVQILDKLYTEIPQARLFEFFPAGGEDGLDGWYAGETKPYLYAKTGSVGNNHNISGYLITNSGKILIFSFMNNHFRTPSSEVKKRMQTVFEELRDKY